MELQPPRCDLLGTQVSWWGRVEGWDEPTVVSAGDTGEAGGFQC